MTVNLSTSNFNTYDASSDSDDDYIPEEDYIVYGKRNIDAVDQAVQEFSQKNLPPKRRRLRKVSCKVEKEVTPELKDTNFNQSDSNDRIKYKLKNPYLIKIFEDKDQYQIVGRDTEANKALRMILSGIRPLLTGVSGIGKRSILKKVSQNHSVVLIDCENVLAKISSSLRYEDVLLKLYREIRRRTEKIIYFHKIERLIDTPEIWDFVRSILKSNLKIAASISSNKTNQYLNKLVQFNFYELEIKECSQEETKKIISNKLKKRPLPINLPNRVIEHTIELAKRYCLERPCPMSALNLLQESTYHFLLNKKSKKISTEDISEIIVEKTGIPVDDLCNDVWNNIPLLESKLRENIIGQDLAINAVMQSVRFEKKNLSNPNRPKGILLCVGPTGVGKTLLAKCLQKFLYNNENELLRLNMETFNQDYSANRILGAEPGLVGYESGAEFPNALLKNPYRVVLLDEFEKAHEKVRKMFLGILEDGIFIDSQGNKIDCTKAFFIMTSNLGSELLFTLQNSGKWNGEDVLQALEPILTSELKPEFCNRVEIIPFLPIKKSDYSNVVISHLKRLNEMWSKSGGFNLKWNNQVVNFLAKTPFEPKLGMRNLCRKIECEIQNLIDQASDEKKSLPKGTITLAINKNTLQARWQTRRKR